MTQPLKESTQSCTLQVRVQPKASRSLVDGFREDVLHVRVTAPPEGGKANAAVVALVAKSLRIASGNVSIVKGLASRNKVLRIEFLTLDEVRERLATVG